MLKTSKEAKESRNEGRAARQKGVRKVVSQWNLQFLFLFFKISKDKLIHLLLTMSP